MADEENGNRKKEGFDLKENIYKPMCLLLGLACIGLAFALGFVYKEGEQHRMDMAKYKKDADNNLGQIEKCKKDVAALMMKANPPMCKLEPFATTQNPSNLSIFDDLTADEFKAVDSYLTKKLGLTTSKRELASSYVLLMDLKLPAKQEALGYLDASGSKPGRYAHAVVYRGDQTPPVVEEYSVGPLGGTLGHSRTREVAWNNRPYDDVETDAIDDVLITPTTERLYTVLMESFKASYHNCTDRCLTWSNIAPYGSKGKDRQMWFFFLRNVHNELHHPLGLQILFNVHGVNTSLWSVEKIVYNFVSYDSVDDFLNAYVSTNFTKLDLPWPDEDAQKFSNLKRRQMQSNGNAKMAPELFEPDGRRFRVSGRHIEYMGWSFDFRVSATLSLQLYDIRFKNERIVYELGSQETAIVYSGFAPTNMLLTFLDSSENRGWLTFELFRGVDCPRTAVFFDQYQYMGGSVKRIKNAVCVFELDAGIPLRRHYAQNYDDEGNFIEYGGLADHVLVLRAIVSNYNDEQIFDYIFHQNGAIEVKATSLGYLHTSLYGNSEEEKPYAYQVQNEIAAPLSQVLVNYKVDLDVQGTSNRAGNINFKVEKKTNPWSPSGGDHYQYNVKSRFYAKNESDFLIEKNFEDPAYILFFNDVKKNKYNRHRAYRLKMVSPSHVLLPEGSGTEPGFSWSRYSVAVTRHKDNEPSSSSIYNAVYPADPVVNFQNFIDGDKLDDEDLVAWVTVGEYRLPSTNDMPMATSTQGQMKFLLLPYNYHNEDPSMTSPNSVYVTPDGGKSKVERYGTPSTSDCKPPMGASYQYDGKVHGGN